MSVDALQLHQLGAADAARAIHDGAMRAEELAAACLARVEEVEPQVHAWAHLDPQHALALARMRDDEHRQGRPEGELHGVPVGVQDIFDTADLPTEDGSPLHAGRAPARDAAAVAMLRAAGAVILGKTATTELAAGAPAGTRNPHDPSRGAGDAAAGSAAAVAAGMVPLALSLQTDSSVIEAASYCGVFGFKPTFGLVPRTGALRLSRTLDQAGVLARSLQDIALVCEQIIGHHAGDPDTAPRARPRLRQAVAEEPPLPPTLAFAKPATWSEVAPDAREAFAELVGQLRERIVEIELPASSQVGLGWHRTIMEAEMAANLEREFEAGRDRLDAALRAQLERGRGIGALEYQKAIAGIARLNEGFDEIFERCDVVLTPAALGTAPAAGERACAGGFGTLWTLCGMPAVSLPIMQGANGLPLGVQLVGPRGSDARLLRTAQWLLGATSSVEA